MGITATASFKSMMIQISTILPGMWHCFWFTISLCIISSNDFHLAYLTIISPTSQVKESMWWFSHLLSMSITIIHSRTREIITGWIWGHIGTTVIQIWAKTLLIPWLSKAPTLNIRQHNILSLPGKNVSSEPLTWRPWIVYFLFPKHIVIVLKVYISPFGESLE